MNRIWWQRSNSQLSRNGDCKNLPEVLNEEMSTHQRVPSLKCLKVTFSIGFPQKFINKDNFTSAPMMVAYSYIAVCKKAPKKTKNKHIFPKTLAALSTKKRFRARILWWITAQRQLTIHGLSFPRVKDVKDEMGPLLLLLWRQTAKQQKVSAKIFQTVARGKGFPQPK